MTKCKPSWPLILFWAVSGAILLFRIDYDLSTWYYGSTIAFYRQKYTDYDYLLHLPPGYHDFYGKRPLLIYLHGAGEVGKDVRILDDYAPYRFLEGVKEEIDFPFIVVSPMCERNGWDAVRLALLVEQLLEENRFRYKIDPDRVYLTGFSMGGFGTFRTACAFPDHFTAIVPLAGGGEPEDAIKLQNVPTWAFHGDADEVVSYDLTKNMIDAMEDLNHPNVKLTTFHGAGHGIPELVYTKPELYQWLWKQRKSIE